MTSELTPQLGNAKFWQRIPHTARWVSLAVLVFIIGSVVILSITDWNFARHRVAAVLSSRLGREVRIDGDLTAHLLSATPSVQIQGLKIGNPDGVDSDSIKERDFVDVEQLAVALNLRALLSGHVLLETLDILNPKILLVRDGNGRNNLFLGNAGKNSVANRAPKLFPHLPGVRRFTLRGGQLSVTDEVRQLKFDGHVEANENSAQPAAEPFRLRGHGELNAEPFDLAFSGGALTNLKMDEPYEFNVEVTTGKTHALASGSFHTPFDFANMSAKLDIKGDNLAHLYYLTGLSLPFSPRYHVTGELQSSKTQIIVHEIAGMVGTSDVKGDATVDISNERPLLTAALTSHSLNLADLLPAVGKGVRVDAKTGTTLDSVAPGELPAEQLMPTYQFEFDRLRTMDADVTLHAESVQAEKVPIKSVDLHLKLDAGVLVLDPIAFALQEGKIAGKVRVDAREKPAKVKLEGRLSGVQLEQFKGKSLNEPPFAGVLTTRAQLEGRGNSMHDIAASATGTVTAVVPHGEIRQAFAELTGINIARGLGLLIKGDKDRFAVRCGVATFDVHDGDAQVQQIVFDTETVLIEGEGNVDLKNEALHIDIAGNPKKLRLLRLRSPLNVRGTLRKPTVGVDAAKTASQVGIATVLGTLLTPLAAALSFIDPGLAKDADCAALLADAEKALPKKQVAAVVGMPLPGQPSPQPSSRSRQ